MQHEGHFRNGAFETDLYFFVSISIPTELIGNTSHQERFEQFVCLVCFESVVHFRFERSRSGDGAIVELVVEFLLNVGEHIQLHISQHIVLHFIENEGVRVDVIVLPSGRKTKRSIGVKLIREFVVCAILHEVAICIHKKHCECLNVVFFSTGIGCTNFSRGIDFASNMNGQSSRIFFTLVTLTSDIGTKHNDEHKEARKKGFQ